MKKIGTILRDARQRAGMTQDDVARATGFSAAYISQVESGRRAEPSFRTVAKLCFALGITTDEVADEMFDREPSAPRRSVAKKKATVAVKKIAGKLEGLARELVDVVDGY